MPRTTELIRVRCFVAAHDLSGALAALPPPSELLITPQTFVPSEHPYKLHVGTYTVSPSSPPQQVYIGLTATPRNGYGPSLRIFIGNKTHSCHILEDAELLQPFRRLWEKSRFDGTGSDSVYKLIRRRVVKGLAYWYFLAEEEKRGEGIGLLVPGTIRGYLVEGLRGGWWGRV
ncbi:hypothetical protein PMIN04_003917 [Paraphaeosphaeria minitans]